MHAVEKTKKIKRKERCIMFEDTEKMKGSVEDLLHDPFYSDVLRRLDPQEINWLLGDDPQNSLFVYSHATRNVKRATFSVPWPVKF